MTKPASDPRDIQLQPAWPNALRGEEYAEATGRHADKPAADAELPEAANVGLIYLASPYSHDDTRIRDWRFDVVCRVAARLMSQGYLVFSPIAHTHPIAMHGKLPTGWDFWRRYDHAQLDAADEMWILRVEGWDRSKGVAGEIEYMTQRGKRIRYVDPTPEELAPVMALTFSERNRRRCESPSGFNHALSSWSLSDWMTATIGEVGEAANVVKKLNRVRDGIPGNRESEEELRGMLADEIADAAIYLDLLAQAAGFDLNTIRDAKFQKTSDKIGYSEPATPAPAERLPREVSAAEQEPVCPQCSKPLQRVPGQPGWMNADQWDAIKAGDWYCETCPDNGRGGSGLCYWRDSEVRTRLPREVSPAEQFLRTLPAAKAGQSIEEAAAEEIRRLREALHRYREHESIAFRESLALVTQYGAEPGGDAVANLRAMKEKLAALTAERDALRNILDSGKGQSGASILYELPERARVQLEKIVCTVPPDDGVVLLSNEGPTHYDAERKCQVYDHEHFSPLGDALMELHGTLSLSPSPPQEDATSKPITTPSPERDAT